MLTIINKHLPIKHIQLHPHYNINITIFYNNLTTKQLYNHTISTTFTTHHKNKNQIQFFNPQQIKTTQKQLTKKNNILNTLKNHQFTI